MGLFAKKEESITWFWTPNSSGFATWFRGDPPPMDVAKMQWEVLGIRYKFKSGNNETYLMDYEEKK